MGEIVSIKKQKNGTFVAEVIIDHEEHLRLQGHTDEVCIFSNRTAHHDANISQRGKNGSTKYFLIPRHLRQGIDFSNRVTCQKIDLGLQTLFTYVVDKVTKK